MALVINKISGSLKYTFTVILLIASIPLYAQYDVSGSMDVQKHSDEKSDEPGSSNVFNDADFVVYPNPVKDLVKIKSKIKLTEGVIITVIDLIGNVVERRVLSETMSSTIYSLNLSGYAAGQYLIHIKSIEGSYIIKKVIKR